MPQEHTPAEIKAEASGEETKQFVRRVRRVTRRKFTPDLPRDMAFFWDLNDDPNATTSITDFDDQGAPAPIKVTFLTRRDQVTKPGFTYGDVTLGT